MEGEVVFPSIQRIFSCESRAASHGAWLPANKAWRRVQAGSGEVCAPIQTRRVRGEIGAAPGVVCLDHVVRIGACRVRLRDGDLKIEDALRAFIGGIEARR